MEETHISWQTVNATRVNHLLKSLSKLHKQHNTTLTSSWSLYFSHTQKPCSENTHRLTRWSWRDHSCLSGESVVVRWEISIISSVHLGAIGWLPFVTTYRGVPPRITHTNTHYNISCQSILDQQFTWKKKEHVRKRKTETKRVEEERRRGKMKRKVDRWTKRREPVWGGGEGVGVKK